MMFASSDNALRSAMSSATSWRTARSSTASGGAPVVAVYRSRLALLQGSGWNEPRVSNPLRCRPAIVPSHLPAAVRADVRPGRGACIAAEL